MGFWTMVFQRYRCQLHVYKQGDGMRMAGGSLDSIAEEREENDEDEDRDVC